MKNFIVTSIVAAFAFVASASQVSLIKGINDVADRGQIVAVEAVTVAADQSVSLKTVHQVTEYTNQLEKVIKPRVYYTFGLTNWNGEAYITTNVWDRFDPEDWRPSNTNHIVTSVTETWVQVTNEVIIGRLPKQTIFVTNDVWSGTASGHYKFDTPTNKYIVGGRLLLDCNKDDVFNIIVK